MPVSAEERARQQKLEEALYASSLRIPRRFLFLFSMLLQRFWVKDGIFMLLYVFIGRHGMRGCQLKSLILMRGGRFYAGDENLQSELLLLLFVLFFLPFP